MRVLEKKMIHAHQPGRAPVCGFATYVSNEDPIIQRRFGWEVSSDIHDDFEDAFSRDNGQSWSEVRPSLRSGKVEGGFLTYIESAVIFVPQREKLVIITDQKFEPALETGASLNASGRLHISVGDPLKPENTTTFVSDFGCEQGLYVSFCNPIEDSRGRILVPVQRQQRDADGAIQKLGFPARTDLPDVLQDVWETGLLIGEWQEDETLSWHLTEFVPYDFERSTRGVFEGTIAEIGDGKLAMILRGNNALAPDSSGYKWMSFSDNGGESWSKATPLIYDDGTPVVSGSSGSALFRSIKNGKLYWLGNLCLNGEQPIGNFPRSPLHMAEVQETPFAIDGSTPSIIDERVPHESAQLQLSNFKFYQERGSGDVILYITRFSENSAEDWIKADLYQYRITLD